MSMSYVIELDYSSNKTPNIINNSTNNNQIEQFKNIIESITRTINLDDIKKEILDDIININNINRYDPITIENTTTIENTINDVLNNYKVKIMYGKDEDTLFVYEFDELNNTYSNTKLKINCSGNSLQKLIKQLYARTFVRILTDICWNQGLNLNIFVVS